MGWVDRFRADKSRRNFEEVERRLHADGLVADETAVCRGLVMEVSANELAVLDDFEAPEFVRRPVTPAGPSAPVDAGEGLHAYLLGDEDQDLALPGTWSLAAFQLAPKHATYLDRITAWATTR